MEWTGLFTNLCCGCSYREVSQFIAVCVCFIKCQVWQQNQKSIWCTFIHCIVIKAETWCSEIIQEWNLTMTFQCKNWRYIIQQQSPHFHKRVTKTPGAVTRDVDIFIWPCLSGPFLLPDGYELASPPYLIYPHIEFEKEVELNWNTLWIWRAKKTVKRWLSFLPQSLYMTVAAQSTNLVYLERFFEVGSKKAAVKLIHFCKLATARRKRGNESHSGGAKSSRKQANMLSVWPPLTVVHIMRIVKRFHFLHTKAIALTKRMEPWAQ